MEGGGDAPPTEKKPRQHPKAGSLRGDVLRKKAGRGGWFGADTGIHEDYLAFCARAGIVEGDEGGRQHHAADDPGRTLAGADEIYLAYCHLSAAGFTITDISPNRELGARFIVAKRDACVRVVVPISTSCACLTPSRMDALVRARPASEVSKDGKDISGITLAFCDNDSVCLLPMANAIVQPPDDKQEKTSCRKYPGGGAAAAKAKEAAAAAAEGGANAEKADGGAAAAAAK